LNTTQIEDLLEIDDNSFDIEYINRLLSDEKEFQFCKNKYKHRFYTIILRSITHESFENNKAEQYFKNILKHLDSLNKHLDRDVGIVVASIDYLSNIKNIIDEPKIIEEKKSEFIAETSTKDELTGLYLRDVFDVFLTKLIDENKRNSEELSLLMIDIDDFKKVNDNYGHQKGDEVLSKVGDILNDTVREMDFAARYGGEELCIIMPNTNEKNASLIANRIREKISKVNFDEFSITVSIGVSQLNENITSSENLILYADKALYKAKNNGKNRIEIYEKNNQ
jgi:diguanylate cyclase (GGDEF)-like protein